MNLQSAISRRMIARAITFAGLLFLSACSTYQVEHEYFLKGVEEVQSRESWNEIECGETSLQIPGYLYSRKIYGGLVIPIMTMQTVERLRYRVIASQMQGCPVIVQGDKKLEPKIWMGICRYEHEKLLETEEFFIEGNSGCRTDPIVYEHRLGRDYCFECMP